MTNTDKERADFEVHSQLSAYRMHGPRDWYCAGHRAGREAERAEAVTYAEPYRWLHYHERMGAEAIEKEPVGECDARHGWECEPLYKHPPKPEPSPDVDYFATLVDRARAAATKATAKFPQPNYVTLKIAEEAGEVVRGAVHYAEGRMPWEEVEGEIVQLLAMLIRFVTEGDQINGVIPPNLTKPEGK